MWGGGTGFVAAFPASPHACPAPCGVTQLIWEVEKYFHWFSPHLCLHDRTVLRKGFYIVKHAIIKFLKIIMGSHRELFLLQGKLVIPHPPPNRKPFHTNV